MNEWKFHKEYDSMNGDVGFLENPHELTVDNVNRYPDVIAFNTLGFLKNKIHWPLERKFPGTNHGIYIKNGLSPDAPQDVTYDTQYGKITLYNNELFIKKPFTEGNYWDLPTLLYVSEFVKPDKDIIDIGAHCGTSSVFYSHLLTSGRVFSFEPQKRMYTLLMKNVVDNGLQDKIITNNVGLFSFTGKSEMTNVDVDGSGGIVDHTREINYGGLSIGTGGEKIKVDTLENVVSRYDINPGFIHCDAQGSESFIFYAGRKVIEQYYPVILFEDNRTQGQYLRDVVIRKYPRLEDEANFNLVDFTKNLGYTARSCPSGDTLLLPPEEKPVMQPVTRKLMRGRTLGL